MSRTSGSCVKPISLELLFDVFDARSSRRRRCASCRRHGRAGIIAMRRLGDRHVAVAYVHHLLESRPDRSRLLDAVVGSTARTGFVPHRDAVPPPELPADAPVALLAEPVEVASWRSARGRTSPGRSVTASIVICARPGLPSSRSPIFTNHWSDRYGSIGVLLRSLYFSGITRSSLPSKRPSSSIFFGHGFAGLVAVQPRELAAVLVDRAVRVQDVDDPDLAGAAASRRSRSGRAPASPSRSRCRVPGRRAGRRR